jgi:hypothetical protein
MGQRTLAFTRLLLKEVSNNTLRNLGLLVVYIKRRGIGWFQPLDQKPTAEIGSVAEGARWRGSKRELGHVGENSGDVCECASAGPRRVRGGQNWQGGSTAQREKKGADGATAQRVANRAREAEREEGRAGEGSRRRQVGPSEQRARERERERERAGEKVAADRWIPPVRRCGRASAAWLGRAGLLFLFLFLWIF